MTNKKAIAEIEKIRNAISVLCQEYENECGVKEAKNIQGKLQTKIDALNMAIIALWHIEMISTEAEEKA